MKTLYLTAILRILSLALSLLAQPPATGQAPNTPKRAEQVTGATTDNFVFAGGTLQDFIKAVQEQFGVDLRQQATVGGEYLSEIRVPKINVTSAFVAGAGHLSYPFQWVLSVYNNLSENGVKGLGKWVMASPQGDRAFGTTIVFVPPGPEELDLNHKLRAFSIEPKNAAEQGVLQDSLVEALNFYAQTRHRPPGGIFKYHPGTGLLIAVGDESYLNVISEVVKALKDSKVNSPEKPRTEAGEQADRSSASDPAHAK